MRKILIISSLLFGFAVSAQEHFSGINSSQRTGFANVGVNPAELANFSSKIEVNVLSISGIGSNNQVGFKDLIGSSDFSDELFGHGGLVNLRLDGEILGPSIAYHVNKWAFAVSSKASANLDMIDVDANLGDAISGSTVQSIVFGSSFINNSGNQRMIGTSWGEIGFAAANTLFEDSQQKFSAGVSLKILFPGSYVNFGAKQFTGTITNKSGTLSLTDADAAINIAYSGNLGDNFTEFNDYFKSLFGKPNGFATDFGVNYQIKDGDSYKLNAGLAVRNLGSMTFKAANNSQTNYRLSIHGSDTLNLNQFQNANSAKDVENILTASGFLDKTQNVNKSFKVTLPTLFSAYADVKIVPTFYVTAYTQFKVKKDDENTQIADQNTFTLTPRYTLKNYEIYLPISESEFSGFATGVGFRAYGFFVGSGSAITALINNAKQVDAYMGYGFKLD